MKVEIDLPEIWVKQFKSLAAILKRADWKQELSWYLEWDGCNFLAGPEDLAEHAMFLLSDDCPAGHPNGSELARVVARRCLAHFARNKHSPLRRFQTEEDLIDRWRVEVGLLTEQVERTSGRACAEDENPEPRSPC